MDPRNRTGEVADLLMTNLQDLRQIACGFYLSTLIDKRLPTQIGRTYPAFYFNGNGDEVPITSYDMFVERIGIGGVELSTLHSKMQIASMVTPIRVVPKNLFIEIKVGDQQFTRPTDYEVASTYGAGIFKPWFQMTYLCDGEKDLAINNFGLAMVRP